MIKFTLTEAARLELSLAYKQGGKLHVRERCQCLLLLADGHTVSELASIFKTRTRTIYTWINRYKNEGYLGLTIRSGRGVKAVLEELTEEQISIVREEIQHNPQSLQQVVQVLSKKFGLSITKAMLKKYLKKNCITLGIDCANG